MTAAVKNDKAPRPVERNEFQDIESVLSLLDVLLANSPLFVEHAYIQLGSLANESPGPTIGLVETMMNVEGDYTTRFTPVMV